MDEVILKSGRKITLLPRTRRVTEAVNNAMFKGVVIESGMDGNGELVMKDMPIPMTNSLAAESIAVELLSGLTHDEFLDLEDEDYDTIKKAIDARDKAKKNSTTELLNESKASSEEVVAP